MRIIDRYLAKEITGPLVLGFVVYTFVLLLRFLFRMADMIIRRGLDGSEVLRLLLYTIPNIVVLTIPMALLFGILIAIGRLSSDSELVALRSSGVSLFSLYRPVLLVSLLLFGLNTGLMLEALPRGNHALQMAQVEIITQTAARQVEPRVFYEKWEGFVLYVFDIPEGGSIWHGVFLATTQSQVESEVTVAERGELRVGEDGERIVLLLENATIHKVRLNEPDRYHSARYRRLEITLDDAFGSSQRARFSGSKGLRELRVPELLERAEDTRISPELRNLARAEIHKKFSIPAACLVFGLLAVPLGFTNARGSKSSGFALSIFVILIYYVLLSNGEDGVRLGRMAPWLGIWMPNIVLTVVGLYLLARRNRDKSLFLGRANDAVQRWVLDLAAKVTGWRARRKPAAATAAIGPRTGSRGAPFVLRLPRPEVRFPNRLDRYVARLFTWIFTLVMLSGLVLAIVADITDNLRDFMKASAPLGILLNYYKYLCLQIIYELAPIAVLLTTLITFSIFERRNEITAMKALGVSLFRLSASAIAMAALVTLGGIYLEEQILPASNQRVAELKDRAKGENRTRTYRRADRQWLFGQGRYVYNYFHYDEDTRQIKKLQVFELDGEHNLVRRLYADEARHTPQGWVFQRGWARTFDGAIEQSFRKFNEPRLSDYQETPGYFESEVRTPEQMRFAELKEYILELEEAGQTNPELWVELHNKLAYPGISLIMAVVALPFGFRLGRKGALYGVGISIVLGMVFLAVFAFFSTLGEAGILPPAVAVWSPNVLFGLFSVFLFLGVRT